MGAKVIPKPIIENQLALKGVYHPISKDHRGQCALLFLEEGRSLALPEGLRVNSPYSAIGSSTLAIILNYSLNL
jgi:hypothetical protein